MSINKEIESIINQFNEFKSISLTPFSKRNIYLKTNNISLYIRKQLTPSSDPLNPNYHLCIASVDVTESHQKKGVFTEILTAIENNIGHFKYITIENILNKDLEVYLLNRGYTIKESYSFDITLSNKPD